MKTVLRGFARDGGRHVPLGACPAITPVGPGRGNRDSRREVHEAVTASDARLVIRGAAENSIALVFSELHRVTCGRIVDLLCIGRWITAVICGQPAAFCGQRVDTEKTKNELPQTLAPPQGRQ